MLTVPIRQLGESERAAVERVLDRDPYAGAQIAERVAAHGLNWWRSDGRIFGYGAGRRVESIVWSGAHLVPVCTTPAATAAFADMLGSETRICSSGRHRRPEISRRNRHGNLQQARDGSEPACIR